MNLTGVNFGASDLSGGARIRGSSCLFTQVFAHLVLSCLCVAVWCSVVQCGAVWCSVVQCGAVWCSVVQCGAVWCSVLQCVVVCLLVMSGRVFVLQCLAVSCSVIHSRFAPFNPLLLQYRVM